MVSLNKTEKNYRIVYFDSLKQLCEYIISYNKIDRRRAKAKFHCMKTQPARRPGPRKETTPQRTDASATIVVYIRHSSVSVWSGVLELCAL